MNCSASVGDNLVSASSRTSWGERRPADANSANADGSVAEKRSAWRDSGVCLRMSTTCGIDTAVNIWVGFTGRQCIPKQKTQLLDSQAKTQELAALASSKRNVCQQFS